MSLFWSFSIAGYFLPLILRQKGVDTDQSTADTYRSYVWICGSPWSPLVHSGECLCSPMPDLPGVTATLFAAAVSGSGKLHVTCSVPLTHL